MGKVRIRIMVRIWVDAVDGGLAGQLGEERRHESGSDLCDARFQTMCSLNFCSRPSWWNVPPLS